MYTYIPGIMHSFSGVFSLILYIHNDKHSIAVALEWKIFFVEFQRVFLNFHQINLPLHWKIWFVYNMDI